MRQEIVAGFRYVRAWPGLLALVIMGAAVNLFLAPASALLPLLVAEHFDGEAMRFGWMAATFGVGMIVGGIALGIWGGFKRRVLTSMCGILGLAVAVLVIGLTSSYGLALGAMFALGFMVTLANGPLAAVLQTVVAPDFQGRVFTLLSTVSLAAAPLGLAIAGPVADLIGVRGWYVAGAIACGLMGLAGLTLPMVFHIEDQTPEEDATMKPS